MRGQIKAVEIILGMFILLVVAVVLLTFFRRFMTQQSTQLEQLGAEQRKVQALEKAKQECTQLCQSAIGSRCSDIEIAQFCLGKKEIDYTGNGQPRTFEYESIAGIYTCEIPVYCFQLVDCSTCGIPQGGQGATACKTQLCNFWTSQGFSDPTQVLNRELKPGGCKDTLKTGGNWEQHWYYLAFRAENITC